MWSRVPALVSGVVLALAVALPLFGFNPREYARAHGGTTRLSIATGNTGGVYYPYGGGLARIISQSVPQVDATAEVTAATVDNLKLIQQGKTDIGFALADTLEVLDLSGNRLSALPDALHRLHRLRPSLPGLRVRGLPAQ